MTNISKTRTFSDIDFNFGVHPVTGDILKKYDETAIKRSIINLILTKPYERPFHPELSAKTYELLFEPSSPSLITAIEDSIREVIENYEPRAEILSIDAEEDFDNHGFKVLIWFHVFNQPDPVELTFFLSRTR